MRVLYHNLTLYLLAITPFIANAMNSNKITPTMIVENITTNISFNPNQVITLSDNSANDKEQVFTVSNEGSNFIKVHFKVFNIPGGAYVLVTNQSGTESYRYDNNNNTARTYNSLTGENGINQFSAMSVFGEQANVQLVLPNSIEWLPSHELVIDSYKAGTETN